MRIHAWPQIVGLTRDDQIQLAVDLISADGDTLTPRGTLAFRSALPESVAVSSTGTVTAVGLGIIRVYVTWSGAGKSLHDSVTIAVGTSTPISTPGVSRASP